MLITIDLGSNTLRIALLSFKDGICYVDKSFERIVGSARGLKEGGEISNEAKERIFIALSEAVKEFEFDKFSHIAVATAAFRMAKNTVEIFAQIRSKFNINFTLISGESEAKYISMGVDNAIKRVGIDSKDSVFIDLGGASSEISNGFKFKSFKFGIITFFEEFKEPKALDENAKFVVTEAKSFLNEFKKDTIVLTSGVATTMASLKLGMNYDSYDANMINGTRLAKDDFDRLRVMLINLDEKSAKKLVGKDRQMLVVAGISLLKALLSDENSQIITIDDGLREGVGVAFFKGCFDSILNFKEQI